MNRQFRQEYSIKQVPTEDVNSLENVLNSMSVSGWELYSIYEAERNNKLVYNCIFAREIENISDEDDAEIFDFRNKVERMLYSKEEPYDLCLNLQRKIRDKKDAIERVKKFLESSKGAERELLNEEVKKNVDELNNLKKDLKEVLNPSGLSKYLGEEKLSISFSSENYTLCDTKRVDNILAQVVKTRQDLTKELGYIIPKVQFIENPTLEAFDFSINIHGVSIISSKAYPDHLVFWEDELEMDKFPKSSVRVNDTLTNRKIVWIKRDECKDYWAHGLEAVDYIGVYLRYCVINNVDEIFDYGDLNRYIEYVQNKNPFLIDNIVGDYVSLSELKYIFSQLIREQVSIKDIDYIFEKLNDFSDDPNKADLLDKLRMSMARQISGSLADENGDIYAYELSDETLKLLEKQVDKEEMSIKLDLSKFSKLRKNLNKVKDEIASKNAVIVAPQMYRHVMFVLISQIFCDIPVICYEEVAMDYELKILGQI